ncbi:ferritin-like domain-containing protein [Rhizobium calliandrae]|uniref:Ferritin-like domain-containing protein n=1 Tax=Rhizobium calliandrae TaxID=1312182 RepID=A0ABT7K9D4_9HYPH|nr:ferritin-like domain-containing protein [Rhizobium calliandrae]MDL2405205.1 ferritin-like domain-containing protein [Rhizobium calliandrae]
MRSRIRRHLGPLLGVTSPSSLMHIRAVKGASTSAKVEIPIGFAPRQYAILLLHVAAEIEHSLLVQYLYAAYSLGGADVPEADRERVAQWREVILGIAKEEMGHLMTVQNLLHCLGAPLNLNREDYPWDSDFYPFPFQLEPLTPLSLAKYIYIEAPSPEEWTGDEADAIRALVEDKIGVERLHRVGALYDQLQALFEQPDLISDANFDGATFPFQVNWDEWGRGYKGGVSGNATNGIAPETPDILLLQITSRTDALNAIKAISSQGEANPTASDDASSHFARFLKIYRHFPKDKKSPALTRPLAVNPVATSVPDVVSDASACSVITHPHARIWAELFNLRYEMLLLCLAHTFKYPSNILVDRQNTPRGLLIHSTFGEMYNLGAIAGILVRTPLSSDSGPLRAGPPFQMPFSLELPSRLADIWRQHADLLTASQSIIEALLVSPTDDAERRYLVSLGEADRQIGETIHSILNDRSIARPLQHQY